MTLAISLPPDADAADFRSAARRCLAQRLPPDRVVFVADGMPSLLGEPAAAPNAPSFKVSREFAQLIEEVACHSADDRFDLLYGLVWRVADGERGVLERASDPAVKRALDYARAVRRDIHKMHAFVRFKERQIDGARLFTAWFEPQHHILKRAVTFFADRFADMDWLIVTPRGSAWLKDGKPGFGPGGARPDDEGDAVLDGLWDTYYRTIFNPARLHVNAMLREMPKRYWRDMPETRNVAEMLRTANAVSLGLVERPADAAPRFATRVADRRVQEMEVAMAKHETTDLTALKAEVQACTRCPLYAGATQAVFGEGPADARLMLVGEQPGDQEDLGGKPFVGPAGRKLNEALEQAGIDRARVYITNAVKHFKYEPRGKRRIHQKPNAGEVTACKWWLEREIDVVKPALIVALGATAAQALAGRPVAVMKERGQLLSFGAAKGLITIHPSFLLRLPDAEAAEREFGRFVADLKLAANALADLANAA